jgi:hypothetical protein
MRKRTLVAFAALLAVGCVLAAETTSGSITRFGVYEMVGPPAGPWKVGSVSPTAEIHAKQGLRFGVDFEISGISEPSAFVVATLIHPPIVKPDGSSETQSVARMGPFPVNDGRIKSVYGFTFDHPYEMVSGNWQIQISYHDHVLAEKSFHVITEP